MQCTKVYKENKNFSSFLKQINSKYAGNNYFRLYSIISDVFEVILIPKYSICTTRGVSGTSCLKVYQHSVFLKTHL